MNLTIFQVNITSCKSLAQTDNFYYQMSKTNNKIIDSVSASDLLRALNTLQNMNDQPSDVQISFCDENKIRTEHKSNTSKIMNFELYMARKTDVKPSKQTVLTQRKSISPLKQQNHNNLNIRKLGELKSRSHSPALKTIQKTERITIGANKATAREQLRDKQNKKEDNNRKSQAVYRASYQSKKILDQKQKKGAVYVPIQLRTEQLMKEKQQKLAKLQKEKQLSKILLDKECTFKPNIIKSYRKPKALPLEKTLKCIQEESIRYDSRNEDNQFLCTPKQPLNLEIERQTNEEELIARTASEAERIGVKKYKNDKFNYLLDLIH